MTATAAFERSRIHTSSFQLLKEAQRVTTRTVNTHKAQHTFCVKRLDVQSFSTHPSNPGGFSIAPQCLDKGITWSVVLEKFSGSNWEKTRKGHKSIKIMSK